MVIINDGAVNHDYANELIHALPDALDYASAIMRRKNHANLIPALNSLVQVKAWRSLHTFHGGNINAWLRTIVNTASNTILSKSNDDPEQYPLLESGDLDPAVELSMGVSDSPESIVFSELESKQANDDIMTALKSLKPQFADTLLLYANGCKYDDIAIRMGCSVGTVMSRLNRARKQMRALLPASYSVDRSLNNGTKTRKTLKCNKKNNKLATN